jgi:hypothetical protein
VDECLYSNELWTVTIVKTLAADELNKM